MEPIFKERGGGQVGGSPWIMSVSATWPFSSIVIYSDKVLLSVGWVKVELHFSDIVDVKRLFILPFIADGVRMVHKKEGVPKWLVFWSFGNAKKIKQLILLQKEIADVKRTLI